MKRVLSGIRPTGRVHIGNYFGALKNWVELQNNAEYETFYMVADIHALTTDYGDTRQLAEYTREMMKSLLSIGLSPEKSVIFIQSMVPQHSELNLFLSMITPLSWLERVPTYKEIQQELKQKDLSTFGFLGYPVLQAADIVLYDANVVPVGKDQMPHLELTREIVRRFNFIYGSKADILVEPEGKLSSSPKVPGIDGRKMSKSYDNCIYLTDTDDVLKQKILPMVTDTNRKRKIDPGDPNKCPVFDLHRIFSSSAEQSEITENCTGAKFGCIDCKRILLKNMTSFFEPIRARRAQVDSDESYVQDVIKTSSEKAKSTAEVTLKRVKEAMNLVS